MEHGCRRELYLIGNSSIGVGWCALVVASSRGGRFGVALRRAHVPEVLGLGFVMRIGSEARGWSSLPGAYRVYAGTEGLACMRITTERSVS